MSLPVREGQPLHPESLEEPPGWPVLRSGGGTGHSGTLEAAGLHCSSEAPNLGVLCPVSDRRWPIDKGAVEKYRGRGRPGAGGPRGARTGERRAAPARDRKPLCAPVRGKRSQGSRLRILSRGRRGGGAGSTCRSGVRAATAMERFGQRSDSALRSQGKWGRGRVQAALSRILTSRSSEESGGGRRRWLEKDAGKWVALWGSSSAAGRAEGTKGQASGACEGPAGAKGGDSCLPWEGRQVQRPVAQP